MKHDELDEEVERLGLEVHPERVGGKVSMAKKRVAIRKAWDQAQRKIDELEEKSGEAEKRKRDAVDVEAAAKQPSLEAAAKLPKKGSKLSRSRGPQGGGRDKLAY